VFVLAWFLMDLHQYIAWLLGAGVQVTSQEAWLLGAGVQVTSQEGHMDKDDDQEMDEARKLAAEAGLSDKFDELADSEKIADELFWQLVEYDLPPKIELDAAVNLVARVLNVVPDEDKQAFCDEARADLDEIIRAVLTPDSEFEARKRPSMLKLVPKRDKD
jgi:hypothetical protein